MASSPGLAAWDCPGASCHRPGTACSASLHHLVAVSGVRKALLLRGTEGHLQAVEASSLRLWTSAVQCLLLSEPKLHIPQPTKLPLNYRHNSGSMADYSAGTWLHQLQEHVTTSDLVASCCSMLATPLGVWCCSPRVAPNLSLVRSLCPSASPFNLLSHETLHQSEHYVTWSVHNGETAVAAAAAAA